MNARALLLAATLLSPAVAWAQSDFYNLDDDRPTTIEDAYPTGYRGIELQAGVGRFERSRRGDQKALLLGEVNYAPWYNLQVGMAGRALNAFVDRRSYTGGSDTTLFALYNVNRETPFLPAFSVRADGSFPTGPFSADGNRFLLKGILSRGFGRLRTHINGAWGFGADPKDERFSSDLGVRAFAGAAVDYPVTYNFLALAESVYFLEEGRGAPSSVQTTLGARWQASPRWVIDAGVGPTFDTGSAPGERGDRVSVTGAFGFTFTPGALGF